MIDDETIPIPKQPIFIDAISLDEELQLIREEFWEEMDPINRAWDSYVPRATWSQPLPMQIFPPRLVREWGLTVLQAQFLQALVYRGEIGMLEAAGLVHRQGFQTALELQEELYRGLSPERILASANLRSQLQKEFEAVA